MGLLSSLHPVYNQTLMAFLAQTGTAKMIVRLRDERLITRITKTWEEADEQCSRGALATQ